MEPQVLQVPEQSGSLRILVPLAELAEPVVEFLVDLRQEVACLVHRLHHQVLYLERLQKPGLLAEQLEVRAA